MDSVTEVVRGLLTSVLKGHSVVTPVDSQRSLLVVSQTKHDGTFPSGRATNIQSTPHYHSINISHSTSGSNTKHEMKQ